MAYKFNGVAMNTIRHLRRCSTAAAGASITFEKAKSKFRTEFDLDKSLELYYSLPRNDASFPSSFFFAQDLLVRRLAKCQRFPDIEKLIESHKSDPQITMEPFLSLLIRSYGRAGMFEQALKTYEQMDELGTPRSAFSFNALLTSCVQSKHSDRVPQLFDEIPKKYGVVPDKISYGILVKSFCEMAQPEKALELLKEMEEKEVEITVVTYTTVLNAFYRNGKTDEAEKLWNVMEKKGCIDAAAYNVRFMYAQDGKPEELAAIIDEMSNAGHKPDIITYNYLMTCYLKSGMVDEAKKVYTGLRENGCKPNSTTFRTMIFHLCKLGDFEQGYQIFKESVRMHKIPDFNTMKYLVEGLAKKEKKKEAKGMIRTMKKKFPPNMLNAWAKVEQSLNLTSVGAESDEADEAKATSA